MEPFHSVTTFGDPADSDTMKVTAAMAAAEASGLPVYFPPGNYLLAADLLAGTPPRCVSITAGTTGIKLVGVPGRSIITFNSRISNCFLVNAGCSKVTFEGLRFEGYADAGYDDFSVNKYAAVRVLAGSSDIDIVNNVFNKTQAVFSASNDSSGNTSSRLYFARNRVLESPVSVAGGATDTIITDNHFENAVPTITQSHAVYIFGSVEKVTITGNTFRGHGNSQVDFRGVTSPRQSKRDLILSGNRFENGTSYITYISTQTSENNLGRLVITNNTARNTGGFLLSGVRDSVISNNAFEWDYEYASTNATGVALIANIGDHSQSIPMGNVISGNTFVNRHPFFGIVTFTARPSAGDPDVDPPVPPDQIVVGTVKYTWTTKLTPLSPGEIRIEASLNECATNLAHCLQGRSTTARNLVLRDLNDVWYSSTPRNASEVNEGKCWIASDMTFPLTCTGTAVTLTAVADCTDHMLWGVQCANTIGTLVTNNSITGGRMAFNDNVSLIVKHNVIAHSAAMICQGNTWPIYEGNEVVWDRSTYDIQGVRDGFVMSYDAFPVIRGGGRVMDQNVNSTTLTLPWLQGDSGWVNVGNGKSRMFFWYGHESGDIDDAAGRQWQWRDGDLIFLYNGNKDKDYTFVFKRSGPNGTTEFNSYASLITLINAHTDGSWVATNPVLVAGGADLYAYGMIELESGEVGVDRNLDSIRITPTALTNRGSRTCGLYLRPWTFLGRGYANGRDTAFGGGAAEATKTVVYSPIASMNTPLIVCGVDARSQARAPVSHVADTIPGVSWTITHLCADGNPELGPERFFYKAG